MRRLLLMRHAKSSWDDPALPDHDRPLAPRGLRDAPRMGRWMRHEGFLPDRILCSPATRAMQTCEAVRTELPCQSEPVMLPQLYEFGRIRPLLDAIASHGGEARTLLVIGHNEALHELAQHLAASGPKDEMRELHRKFPTAAIVVLEFNDEDWPDTLPRRGRLIRFMRPKKLPES